MILDKYTHKITSETKGREDLAEYLNHFFDIKTNCIGWHIRLVNTREKSSAFKLEYILSISPGSHKTTNKPRLLSRGKNPKGFVIYGMIVQQRTGGREYYFIFSEIGENGSRLYTRVKKIRADFIIHVDDISEIYFDDKRKVAAFSAEPLEVY